MAFSARLCHRYAVGIINFRRADFVAIHQVIPAMDATPNSFARGCSWKHRFIGYSYHPLTWFVPHRRDHLNPLLLTLLKFHVLCPGFRLNGTELLEYFNGIFRIGHIMIQRMLKIPVGTVHLARINRFPPLSLPDSWRYFFQQQAKVLLGFQ